MISKASTKVAKKPVLLAGGNPQIAKGEGDAPVQAYIAAMPSDKRELGRRIDELVVRTVPNVRKAVKWNSPFYGVEDQGWFLSFHTFTSFVKVTFFRGTSLRPEPPGGTAKDARWINIGDDDLDEANCRSGSSKPPPSPAGTADREGRRIGRGVLTVPWT